jgi:23S rRNA U2552 (ribose-2'-O)-methylase RlmE/FtsJ
MSFDPYPILFSTNQKVLEYYDYKLLNFNIEINTYEFNENEKKLDDILLKSLKKLENKITSYGFILKIDKLVSRTPGRRNMRRVGGGYVFTCIISAICMELNDNYIFCNVKNVNGDGEFNYGQYDDLIKFKIDISKIDNDLISNFNNVRSLDIKGNLSKGLNNIFVYGLPFVLYDIPKHKRMINLQYDNKSKPKFNIEINTIGEENSSKYGYFKTKFDELELYISNHKNWNNELRRIINPYELIKTTSIIDKKYKISEKVYPYLNNLYNLNIKNPVSRAYFKLIEILHILKYPKSDTIINVAAIADAPGGFAQAYTQYFGKNVNVLTTSLKTDLIVYDKLIINNKQITIDYLKTKDGDITNIENILYIEKIKTKFEIVSCDGAFDHDKYNKCKEILHIQLLLAEIVSSLLLCKIDGYCIIKLYNRYTDITVKLLYWFSSYFENIKLYKPKSSRIASQEVFIIGEKFKGLNSLVQDAIHAIKIMKSQAKQGYIRFFSKLINVELPDVFVEKIFKYNTFIHNTRRFCYNFANELSEIPYNKKIYHKFQLSKCMKFLD